MNQAIALKFSAFVHHMSALNWQKNFGHYIISVPVAPSQCLKTQKEDKKIADGWNVDFLYYYDIF